MRWRSSDPRAGLASWIALALVLVLGCGWLAWPVVHSATAPGREAVGELTGSLLTALAGLLVLLAWAVWHDAGRRMAAFAPVVALASVAALVRLFLMPSSSGIEPVFGVPLLAGTVLGGPAGFLTGALACLGSSAVLGTALEAPIIGQCLIWGLWGAVGGLLRPLRARPAWLLGILACLPLALASGIGLNLIGWTGERSLEAGSFLPGVTPADAARRLWAYTQATSASLDLMRGLASAGLVAAVGLPVIRAFRGAFAPPAAHVPDEPNPRPPEIAPQAVERRAKSAQLTSLWTERLKENA